MKSIYDAEGLQQMSGLLETQNGEKLYHWGSGNWSRLPLQGNFKDIKQKNDFIIVAKRSLTRIIRLCSCFLIVFLTKPKLRRVKNIVWEWGRQKNEKASSQNMVLFTAEDFQLGEGRSFKMNSKHLCLSYSTENFWNYGYENVWTLK